MTAFHYRANKVAKNEETVTYDLCTDFFFDPDAYIKVVLRKADLKVLNYDQIKDLPDFNLSEKPLNWLKAKSTNDRVQFEERLKHLA